MGRLIKRPWAFTADGQNLVFPSDTQGLASYHLDLDLGDLLISNLAISPPQG